MRPDKDRYTLFMVYYKETLDKTQWECVDLKPVTWGLTYDQAKALANEMKLYEPWVEDDGTVWKCHRLPGVVLDGCALPKQEFMIPSCFEQWQRNYYELIESK